MPMIDGKFVPRPVKRLRGALFDVLPPGHPDETSPATEDECRWYESLVDNVTGMVIFIVGNVRRNYDNHLGVKFDNRTVGKMYRYANTISALLDNNTSPRAVARAINRLTKQLGLVTYDPTLGTRHNWPMPGVAFIHAEDAERMVRDAFWGHYPEPTTTQTPPQPPA